MKLLDIIKNSIKQAQQRNREAQYTNHGNDPFGALDMYYEDEITEIRKKKFNGIKYNHK